ncbi:MAG TPA: roadblock/LC7 domain-containing protein [candidate division Zixibacteria bacterium]|nr:roadblock/LC7 domain-containing protein [candidate division Zixibacteria bacterium]
MPRHRFITPEEQKQIDALLRELLKNSDAKTAILLDQGGFLMSVQGFTEHIDPNTIAVLAAGSFATTRELAKLIGEEEFTVMFHQGRRDNIHISAIGKDALLVVIFENTTTIGMVRLFARETAKKLAPLLDTINKRKSKAPMGNIPLQE